MTVDFLRRAVRDGPDAFGPSEYGKRAIACYIHWRTLAGTAMLGLFLWAVWPYYIAQPTMTGDFFEAVQYTYGLIPWLVLRPLRLLAVLPLTLWLVQWIRVDTFGLVARGDGS